MYRWIDQIDRIGGKATTQPSNQATYHATRHKQQTKQRTKLLFQPPIISRTNPHTSELQPTKPINQAGTTQPTNKPINQPTKPPDN